MRGNILIAAALAFLALGARANDGIDLSLRSKALAAAATVREIAPSPAAPADNVMPLLPVMGEATDQLAPRSTCELSARDVCYDAVAGRIVVRPAREFMPRINGLTPENLSVRHNRVTFTYSFR